jgi:hypothetical protein
MLLWNDLRPDYPRGRRLCLLLATVCFGCLKFAADETRGLPHGKATEIREAATEADGPSRLFDNKTDLLV